MSDQTRNLFLDALPVKERDLLLCSSSLVLLPLRKILIRPNERSLFAYFLVSGVASAVIHAPDGNAAEVGMQGRESVIGGIQLLGSALPSTENIMQSDGAGFRIQINVLRRMFADYAEVRTRILEIVQAEAFLASQIAGCHALHETEARLSRWLLMAQDRTGLETLQFTQEFLAEMLGTERTTISAVASALQEKKLIEYSRGRIKILDRKRLISTACTCYPVTQALLNGTLIQQRPPASEVSTLLRPSLKIA